MDNNEVILLRDCKATLVPAGDVVVLEKGSSVFITQALGGTITVRNAMGLYRIGGEDLDALGAHGICQMKEEVSDEGPFSEESVWRVLRSCYDPEIPINIVDLGLIYDLVLVESASGKYKVSLKMTLTAQGCGMGPSIAADAKEKIERLSQVSEATVDIVWDPVWNPQMISDEGRVALGIN